MSRSNTQVFDAPKEGVITESVGSTHHKLFSVRTPDGVTIANTSEITGDFTIGSKVILKKRLHCELCGGGGPLILFGGVTWYPGITYYYKDDEGTEKHYLELK